MKLLPAVEDYIKARVTRDAATDPEDRDQAEISLKNIWPAMTHEAHNQLHSEEAREYEASLRRTDATK